MLTVGSGGTRTAQSLRLSVNTGSRAHPAVLGLAGLGRNLLLGIPREPELPPHGPEPAALGTRGR